MKDISIIILVLLSMSLNLLKGYVSLTVLSIALAFYLLLKNKQEMTWHMAEVKKFSWTVGVLFLVEFLVTGARGFLPGDIDFWFDSVKYALFLGIVFVIVIGISDGDKVLKSMMLVPLVMIGQVFIEFFFLHINRPGIDAPNLFAWQLLCVFPFLFLGVSQNFSLGGKLLKLFLGITWLSALFLTQSRGCMLAAVIMGLVFVYYYYKIGRLQITDLFKLALVLLIVVALNYQTLIERINASVDYKNNYTVERLYIWQSSIKMFKDNIFTGIGLDSKIFKEKYDNEYMLPEAKEKHVPHSHNNFLYFFAQTGLFGGMAFIFMMFSQIRYFYSQSKSSISEVRCLGEAGVWIVGCTIISQMVDANFHFISMQKIYWVILGVLFGCIQIYKKYIYLRDRHMM